MESPEPSAKFVNINSQIWEKNLKLLENLDTKHPKLLILFAGVPGSGKTTLASEIIKKFDGIHFRSDDVRDILGELLPLSDIDERNEIIKTYEPYALDRLREQPNGLIILDSSIDRKYRQIFDWANHNGYQKITINFDIPREIAEKRILASKANPNDYLEVMDRWINEHKQFTQNVSADITISQDESPNKVLSMIKEKLRP